MLRPGRPPPTAADLAAPALLGLVLAGWLLLADRPPDLFAWGSWLAAAAPLLAAAIAQSQVVLAGGQGLAAGSVALLVNALIATRMQPGLLSIAGWSVGALALGAAIGTANGWLIDRLRLSSMAVTLATSAVVAGVTFLLLAEPAPTLPDGFVRLLTGSLPGERQERAAATLRLVGLAGFERHRIWELSGGMRQRVGLARALTSDPRVLLMDEPLGALDALTREQMQEQLLELWSQTGKTILMITHGIEEAVLLASHLVILTPRPGRITARFELAFGQRFRDGEPARRIKADPDFVAARQRVADIVLNARQAA